MEVALPGSYSLQIIGYVRTPFKEKFGIPRQPGLVPVPGCVEMNPPWDSPELFDELEAFSHLWLTFVFHDCIEQGWRSRVRPPRLGGNQRLGVFATRSPFRPNHLGLSVVKLERIENRKGRVVLHVRGVDLLDQTPLLDIKPYLPYTDAVPEAMGGFAPQAPQQCLDVIFCPAAQEVLQGLAEGEELKSLIEQLISLDPRPAYKDRGDQEHLYGMRLDNLNIRWRVAGRHAEVVEIRRVKSDQ